MNVWSFVSPLKFHGLCQYTNLFRYVDVSDVTTSNGRFSGLIGFFGNFNAWYVILYQTFINFVENCNWLLWKCVEQKCNPLLPYVSIYGYVSLVVKMVSVSACYYAFLYYIPII